MKPTIRIRSIMMGFLASDTRRSLGHLLGRLQRSAGPTVHYFHQVDDPYSHIAVQKLDTLRSRYQVQFNCHLVPSPTPAFQGDSERFAHWALRDARTIASYYGACLPDAIDQIDPEQTAIAAAELASLLASDQFADRATKLGNSLWSNETLPASDFPDAPHHIESGGKLREKLGHYLGAMFYFEGEWYWGVDRLYHLEHRLIAMGYCNKPDAPICVQRPAAESATGKNAKEITLEYVPIQLSVLTERLTWCNAAAYNSNCALLCR
jgi:2-hydroxychromene-2-carboxylate isomerase